MAEPQRRDRERGEAFDREPDQAAQKFHVVRAVRARGGLVIDANLAESNPACETLEEAAALRQPDAAHRRRAARAGGSRRHLPESSGGRPS